MATVDKLLARLRLELGDLSWPVNASVRGDGATTSFNLPATRIDPITVDAYIVSPQQEADVPYTEQEPVSPVPAGDTVHLVVNTDYTLDYGNGVITLTAPLADGAVLVVNAKATALFSDADLTTFLSTALAQQTHGRHIDRRYVDGSGYVRYAHVPMGYENLPEVEEYPLVILAEIEALWVLATEASMDIDVSTATGTTIPRSQRYSQLRAQLEALQERYNSFAHMLGIGLDRIEMSTLRRTSRTTGRYVPIYVPREYDDYNFPERVIPPIDQRPMLETKSVLTQTIAVQAGRAYELLIDFGADIAGWTFQGYIWPTDDLNGRYSVAFTSTINAGTNTVSFELTATETNNLGPYGYFAVYATRPGETAIAWTQGRVDVQPTLLPRLLAVPVTQTLIVHLPGETAQNAFKGDPAPYLYAGLPTNQLQAEIGP